MAWLSVCGCLSVLWRWRKWLWTTRTAVCATAALGPAPGNPGTPQVEQNHHAGLQARAHTCKSRKWRLKAVTGEINWGLIPSSASICYRALCGCQSLLFSCPDSATQCLRDRLFILHCAKVLCAVSFALDDSLLFFFEVVFFFQNVTLHHASWRFKYFSRNWIKKLMHLVMNTLRLQSCHFATCIVT